MAGLHTTIEVLSHKLLERWVPKWYEAFCDHEFGGFYERLGHSFKPVYTGKRRLITQCRQLSVYADASVHGIGRRLPGLDQHFNHIINTYSIEQTGGWLFSIDDEGKSPEQTQDLYALGFVIFSFAHYYRATGDERARDYAIDTLTFIDKNFRINSLPGFCEALDEALKPIPTLRRHESHMHLLEACLFASEIFGDHLFMRISDELVDLFRNYFYDENQNILSEYYNDELSSAVDDRGQIVIEPGHYCEWIWLLKKHAHLCGEPSRYDRQCRAMLEWASIDGWDDEYGGIYDELNPNNEVISDTKRIWPFAEALKANALMLDSGVDKLAVKKRIAKMIKVFKDHYMLERGFWTEWLSRDLKPQTDYMPGTTPYHVYFGVMETLEVIRARGRTRSLVTGPFIKFYRLRRTLSNLVREARLSLKTLKN